MWMFTLQEQRQEGDEEHQEDTEDTPTDPVKDRHEVIAPRLSTNENARAVVLAYGELFVERA